MENLRKVKKKKGFTLLEMLIVIGLLVIVTTVAIPQFKKCFEDIHLNKSLDDLDSLMQSTRSYYLVMNEFPDDGTPTIHMPAEAGWAFQTNFLGEKQQSNGKDFYIFTVKPWKGFNYDWDCWTGTNYHSAEWVLLFSGQTDKSIANRALFKQKLLQRYGIDLDEENSGHTIAKKGNKNYTYLNFPMVETPKIEKEENYWNRYY